MATKQSLQIECFSKIASGISGFEPRVTKDLINPQVITSSFSQYTPALTTTGGFMQVQQKGTTSRADTLVSMMNTGQNIKLYKFVLYFKTPTANPRLNLAGTEGAIYQAGALQSSSGLRLTFSGMESYLGKDIAPQGITRVSGIDAAPDSTYRIEANTILTDDVACDGTGPGGACSAKAADLAQVKAKIPTGTGVTSPLRGTVELNTGGVPVKKVTVNVGAKLFYNTNPGTTYKKDAKVNVTIPGLALAPQFRSEVSAFPRTLGKYGDAMHAMPFTGNDNLRLGATIQEGNRNRYTTTLNSGTPDDNSDAGYDGMGTFYWEGDKTKTPVKNVTSKDKGKWLMLDLVVSSKRTDKTAYVYGFIDWTGKGDFAKVDKGKSTLGCVSKGNGKVTIKWKVPSTVTTEPLNVRLRTAYDCCEIDKPTGPALSGEVEDWPGVINRQKNNLKVAKSVVSGASARSGDTVTYQISVTNLDGKATPSAVTLTDTLPAELTGLRIEVPPTYGNATIAGQVLTWTLPAGLATSPVLRVSGTLADGVPDGDVTNTAKLSALCDPGNCEATATFHANPAVNADLTLTHVIESMSQTPAQAGTTITYLVTIGYEGDVPLNNLTFTHDRVPAGAAWTCSVPLTPTVNPGFATTCRATYTVTASDMSTYWDDGQLPATADVKGNLSVSPYTELNRSVTVNAPLDTATPRLDITGTVTADAASAVPGQTVTFTITATNEGQATATGVDITRSLNGAAPVTIDPAGCTWPGLTSQLAPGDTVTCDVTYTATTADVGKDITLAAAATALDGTTPYGPVDLGSASVPVLDSDLVITKANSLPGDRPVVHLDSVFEYLITVENNGGAPATNVRVVDDLPVGLAFEPPTQTGWTFSGRQATSDAFSVDPGESVTLHLGVKVTKDSDGSLVNVATIQGVSTTAQCRANAATAGCAHDDRPPFSTNSRVTAVKSSDVPVDQEVEVGRLIEYTITVANVSSLDATDVVVNDILPTGLRAEPGTQPGWTFTGPLCAYEPFDLAAGATRELTLIALATEPVGFTVRNSVAVISYGMPGLSTLGKSAAPATGAAAENQMPFEMCLENPDIERCAFADFAGIVARRSVQAYVFNTSGPQVKAGDRFSYVIPVINTAAEPSKGFGLRAVLPAGLVFDGVQDPVWKVDGNTATLDVDSLPAAASTTFWLRVKVAPGAQGLLQLFTMADGQSLQVCQADWAAAGCGADRNAPVVK